MPKPRKHTQPERDWFSNLPDDALIREAQIVSTDPSTCPLINVGAATFWRWIASGKAPQPVRVTTGFSAWRCGDLRKWLAELPTASVPRTRGRTMVGVPAEQEAA